MPLLTPACGSLHLAVNTRDWTCTSKISAMLGTHKKKFRQEHQTEITLYETARKVLKERSEDGKLPSMKLLKAEKEKLTARKNSQYETYQNLRGYEKELHTVQTNIATFLGKDRSRQNEQEKDNARS